jgi:hypothetical protein
MGLRALVIAAAMFGLVPAVGAAGLVSQVNPADILGAPASPYMQRVGERAPYKKCCGEGYRFVYAESWYGFKKVVAPVRRAEHGDQVRLPGGTWVYCEFSCEYTLRKQSLDFWEGASGQGQSVSPGYFRKDFYIDSWGQRRGYLF